MYVYFIYKYVPGGYCDPGTRNTGTPFITTYMYVVRNVGVKIYSRF